MTMNLYRFHKPKNNLRFEEDILLLHWHNKNDDKMTGPHVIL